MDLGCGTGRLYEIFKGKNIDYTGIDFSENLIRIAKENYGDRFVVGDILSLPPTLKSCKPERGINSSPEINHLGKCSSNVKEYGGLPFPDNYFDSVWSIAVLHHIPMDELRKRVLIEIKRVLKPRGRVIATCWRIKSFFRKDVFIPFHGKKRYYHVFTKKEFKKLFEESGFKIEELRDLKRGNKKTNILIIGRKL